MMQLSNFGYFPSWNLSHTHTNMLKMKPDSVSPPFFRTGFVTPLVTFMKRGHFCLLAVFPGADCSLPPLPAGENSHPAWLQHFSSWPLLPICSWGLPCSSSGPWRPHFLVKSKQKKRDESWKWVDDHKRETNLILQKVKRNSNDSMKTHLLWSGGQKHIKNTNKSRPKVVLQQRWSWDKRNEEQ